jgi:hypothetical protein
MDDAHVGLLIRCVSSLRLRLTEPQPQDDARRAIMNGTVCDWMAGCASILDACITSTDYDAFRIQHLCTLPQFAEESIEDFFIEMACRI